MRPVLLAVPAIAAAVLLTGSACAATESTPSAPVAAPTASKTAEPTTAPPSAKVGAKAAGAKAGAKAGGGQGAGVGTGAPACRTSDVAADVTFQPERSRGNTRMAMVMLTNKSKHACTVGGWASISLVNQADEVVPVRTTEVKQPGAPVPATLKPGLTAFAGIKWTACDKGDDTCGAGNTLRFNLQGSTGGDVARLDGFPNPESSDITMKSLQIGSVQPIRIGVVAW